MKKRLSLFLATLLLLPTLAACGKPTDDPQGDDGTKDDAGVTEQVTADPNYVCDLPSDLNYGGDDVTILYNGGNGRKDELVSEKLGNGVVADAVYERNLAVEEMLEIKLQFIEAKDIKNDLAQDIQSGAAEYEIVANATTAAVIPAMDGHYLNLNALENIDTTKHYWTQGYNEMATFTSEDIQFLASGPIAISMFRYMYLTLYNKTLFEDYKIPDLYETVKAGEWTLDYQYSIVKDHYVDKDGDAKSSEGDFYGFVTGDTVSVDPYMVASNLHMIIRDPETGDLVYNTEAQKGLSDLCDKTQLLYNDDSVYVYKTATYDDVGQNYIINHFSDGNAMMVTTMFYAMETNFESLAAMSYGIAPMPKMTQSQKNYSSYVQDQVNCFGISSGIGDSARQEKCAATLEAMAYHSYLLVRPAYYETALSERYMQDPQSKEGLDLIFDSLDFDFSSAWSDILGSNNIRNTLRVLLSGAKNTIASSTKSWQRAVQRQLDKYNQQILENVS